MREAFTYMFKDNCYYKKAGIYLVLNFIANAFIAYAQMKSCTGGCPLRTTPEVMTNTYINTIIFNILGILANMFVIGYFFSCINAIIKQSNNIVLPFFNAGNCFIKGLKFHISTILITLLFFVLSIPLNLINSVFAMIIFISIIAFYLVFGCSFFWSFATDSKILTFFNVKEAFNNVKKASLNYLKNIFLILLVTIISIIFAYSFELLSGFLIQSQLITMLVSTFITAIISAYFGFVSMFLIAKSIKSEIA